MQVQGDAGIDLRDEPQALQGMSTRARLLCEVPKADAGLGIEVQQAKRASLLRQLAERARRQTQLGPLDLGRDLVAQKAPQRDADGFGVLAREIIRYGHLIAYPNQAHQRRALYP